ncbi:MAG: radical SAM protein, partial [Deltaproteobacteria bacterium]
MSGMVNIRKNFSSVIYRAGAWHIKHYLTGRAGPMAATFQLTNRCNLRCVMCNIPNNPIQGVLDLGAFKKTVRGLSLAGCCYASLSGGEVLTIGNFFEYLREAKAHIPSVNTVTNGVLLDEAAAREFRGAGVDSVSLSLDGMERSHEFTRGLKGSFAKTVGAIENLKKYAPEVKIVVNTVISPWNIDELYELTDFVERLGVMQKFQPLNEHPVFEGQKKAYSVDKEIDIDKLKGLIGHLLRKKTVANSSYFLRAIPDYFAGKNGNGLFSERCLLPYFFCEFREDGMMYPCLGGKGWNQGYPVERGVENIFFSPEYREDIRRLEGCRFCQRSFSVCYIEPRVNFP